MSNPDDELDDLDLETEDEAMARMADAQIEDTLHCDLCGCPWQMSTRADGITVNARHNAGQMDPGQMVQLKLCIDCALHVALTLKQELAEKDVCEHGVVNGDWCEPCNREYKRAAAEQHGL